jgi:ketosteroid isomerase-like protein
MDSVVNDLLRLLEAFNRDDFDTLAELVDPEVVYRIPGRMSFAGEHHGLPAVTGALRQLRNLSGGTITAQPEIVLSDGAQVMFTARVRAVHRGRALDVVNAYVYRFTAGRLAEARLFPGDLHAIEAFFAA